MQVFQISFVRVLTNDYVLLYGVNNCFKSIRVIHR